MPSPSQSLDGILADLLWKDSGKAHLIEHYPKGKLAHRAITQLIKAVIGEDETDDYTEENTEPNHIDWSYRNTLRTSQRQTAKSLGIDLTNNKPNKEDVR